MTVTTSCYVRAGRDRHVSGEGTGVRACVSSFQNMKRTTGIPEPRITVVVLRWRLVVRTVRVFRLSCMALIAGTAGRDPWLIRGDPWLIRG